MELGVDNVDEKGEEEEDAGDDHPSGVEDVRDILQCVLCSVRCHCIFSSPMFSMQIL